MIHRYLAAAMLVALSFTGVAAKENWKTLTLRGEPGLTISVPTAANNMIDEKNPDDLMFIALKAGLHGDMVCIAHRSAYPDGVTRASFAAALASERRETFCRHDRKTVSDVSIESARSFQRNGWQGAVCTASFTDSAEKTPGRVQSQLLIAAARKIYVLTCTSEDEDQEIAEYEWSTFWGEKVRHIQDSFNVPE
ncbi:MAG: hypothetical protein KBA31_21110 [Alphaproteobacteria bacterium]|nr:hypothetical protein [Alphaproteobacteria bacterium]